MKLSRKSIIAIVAGVVLLVAVVVVAFAFISNGSIGIGAAETPTLGLNARRLTLQAGGLAGGFNGTPGAGFNGTPGAGGFNGTPGAGGFGGRTRGTPTETPGGPTNTPTATLTPPITPTFTSTPTFTPTATVQEPFSLYFLSSPVKSDVNGVEASAQVLTDSGNTCILVFTNTDGKVLNVAGTGATTADSVGICEWSWLIPGGTKPGNATVAITVNQYTLSYPIVVK
jgi:hypothetical protein